MLFSCLISTVGILLLGRCHEKHSVSYPLLGRKAFGGYGYFMIAGQVAFSQFCFCASSPGSIEWMFIENDLNVEYRKDISLLMSKLG